MTERIKHAGPDTQFCVLCLSGEHDQVLDEPTLCGFTISVGGSAYPPCERPAGHREVYCCDAAQTFYFIAANLDPGGAT